MASGKWCGKCDGALRTIIFISNTPLTDKRKESRGKNIHTVAKQELLNILHGIDVESKDPSVSATINHLDPHASRMVIANTLWSVLAFTGRLL